MPETLAALHAGRLKELDTKVVDVIIVMVGRVSAGIEKFFGQSSLPVIMGSTRIAYLIMLDSHCIGHTGWYITLAMSKKLLG